MGAARGGDTVDQVHEPDPVSVQGHRATVLAVRRERLVEPLLDEAAVAEAGEGVRVGEAADPLVVLDLAEPRRDQASECHPEVDVV